MHPDYTCKEHLNSLSAVSVAGRHRAVHLLVGRSSWTDGLMVNDWGAWSVAHTHTGSESYGHRLETL